MLLFVTLWFSAFQAALQAQNYPEFFQKDVSFSWPLTTSCLITLQEYWLTSAEHRKACHRKNKALTISEFTSAQAQGSERSDGPPMITKDKGTQDAKRGKK